MEQQPETKRELDSLIKETEKNREELKKSWEKVKDLRSKIQAVNEQPEPKSKGKKRQ